MNNKGFTLVELLATVVILGLVMGIGAYGVSNTINNARKRSEEIFVGKLSNAIEEYIDENGNKLSVLNNVNHEFNKCYSGNCTDYGTYYEASARELANINISVLFTQNILDKQTTVNPVNKKKCFDTTNPVVRVFKDSDYVYYYYVNLSGSNTNCEISDENAIINTLPDNLYNKLVSDGVIVE